MPYTFPIPFVETVFSFIQESVLQLRYTANLEPSDIYIQVPSNFLDACWQYHRTIFGDSSITFAEWKNQKIFICGAELHPVGYESKVVVYYKKVSYRGKDLIRTMDL